MIIDNVLRDEKIRNERMRAKYSEEIAALQKGSLFVQKRNGKAYCYLRYRKNGKVISEYVGPEELAETLKNNIDRRKHMQKMLKMLDAEFLRITKMEKIK